MSKNGHDWAIAIFIDKELIRIISGKGRKHTLKSVKEAKKEVGIGKTFDQIVVNNDFDQALDDLRNFISSGKEQSQERKDVVKKSLNLLLD